MHHILIWRRLSLRSHWWFYSHFCFFLHHVEQVGFRLGIVFYDCLDSVYLMLIQGKLEICGDFILIKLINHVVLVQKLFPCFSQMSIWARKYVLRKILVLGNVLRWSRLLQSLQILLMQNRFWLQIKVWWWYFRSFIQISCLGHWHQYTIEIFICCLEPFSKRNLIGIFGVFRVNSAEIKRQIGPCPQIFKQRISSHLARSGLFWWLILYMSMGCDW